MCQRRRRVRAVGVLGAGFGGVDRDPQVVAGDDESVAVECDESDVGMVDDLVPGLIPGRADLARLPQLSTSVGRTSAMAASR